MQKILDLPGYRCAACCEAHTTGLLALLDAKSESKPEKLLEKKPSTANVTWSRALVIAACWVAAVLGVNLLFTFLGM